MTDATDSGAHSAITDFGGLDIELSEHELYYLRAAGIPPHLLNSSDRAAVIRALMYDTQLIEDHKAGGFASLIFTLGALRDMLELTQDEKEEAELDALGVDAETRSLLKGSQNKLQLLMQLRMRREQEMDEYRREIEERELERERRKEKERIERELVLFNQMGPAHYAEINPIPVVVLGQLLAQQSVYSAKEILLDDDGVSSPIANRISPDPTPNIQSSTLSSVPILDKGRDLDNTNSKTQLVSNPNNDSVSAAPAPKSINFKDMPVTQQDIIQALADIPKSIKLVAEAMLDQDPTHLKTELPEKKVHHDDVQISHSLPKKPNQ